jgi:hypothetical protein
LCMNTSARNTNEQPKKKRCKLKHTTHPIHDSAQSAGALLCCPEPASAVYALSGKQ